MVSGLLLSALLVQTLAPRIEGGVVAGTLRQPNGNPAAGVRVAAMAADETAAGNLSTLAVLTQTDAAGHYRLEDIPPGRYYIVAGRVNTPTFYPGAQDAGSGKVITVTAGTTNDGIDFQATAESLRPAAPFGRGGRGNLQALQGLTNSLNQARQQLPVRGVPIDIRVVLHEDSKNASLPARLTLEVRRSGSVIISAVQTARNGRSMVNLQPGESNITVIGLPQGYSIRSMTSGNTNLLAGPIVVHQGMPEIIIVVSTGARI
jgi:Carboxypeptidase regulatory-like domain